MQWRLRQRHKVDSNPTVHHPLLRDLGVVWVDAKVSHPRTNYDDAVSGALQVPVHKVLVEHVERRVDGFEKVAMGGI